MLAIPVDGEWTKLSPPPALALLYLPTTYSPEGEIPERF